MKFGKIRYEYYERTDITGLDLFYIALVCLEHKSTQFSRNNKYDTYLRFVGHFANLKQLLS